MYLLDTNIIIYVIRHPSSPCALKIAGMLRSGHICISVITYSELMFGVYNSKAPEQTRNALNAVLAGIGILDFDAEVAETFGYVLSQYRKKGNVHNNKDRDLMIASHALSLNCTLVTNNIKDFKDIDGLSIEDWIHK